MREMFNTLPLKNNPITFGLSFLLPKHISNHSPKPLILYILHLGYIIQYFYKYHPYHLSIQ